MTESEGKALAEKEGISFFETSAVTNINVSSAFEELVERKFFY